MTNIYKSTLMFSQFEKKKRKEERTIHISKTVKSKNWSSYTYKTLALKEEQK